MTYYVVAALWESNGECDVEILGVKINMNDAKRLFLDEKGKSNKYAKEKGWTVYEDSDICYQIGGDNGGDILFIKEVNENTITHKLVGEITLAK